MHNVLVQERGPHDGDGGCRTGPALRLRLRLVRLRFVRFAFRAFCVLCVLPFGCVLKNVTQIQVCVSVAF